LPILNRGRLSTAPLLAIVLVCTFVVFSPALKNGFVNWDDDVYVLNNDRIQSLTPSHLVDLFARPYYSNYIPLTLLSHALDVAIWRYNAWGHHLTSLVLHVVNTGWVFVLALMLLVLHSQGRPPEGVNLRVWFRERLDTPALIGSAFAALLFGLHPLRTESVAWVSDRKDLLCAAFAIPSVLAFIAHDLRRGSPAARRWYWLGVVLAVFAMLSKPVAVVLPLVVLILEGFIVRTPGASGRWKALVREQVPLLALSVVAGIVTVLLGAPGKPNFAVRELDTFEQLLLPLYSLTFYLWKALWPVGLLPVYPRVGGEAYLLGTLAFLVLTATALVAWRRGHTSWPVAWLCYLLFLLPTLGGIRAGIQPWTDRYAYLALVSIFVMAGGALRAVLRSGAEQSRAGRRVTVVAVALVLLGLAAFLTIRQISVWNSSESLWSYAIAGAPDHPTPYNSLGAVYADRGERDAAAAMFREAINRDSVYHKAYANLAGVEAARGDTAMAAELYRRARSIRPDYVEAYTGLGALYLKSGRPGDAITEFRAALDVEPTSGRAAFNAGLAYYQTGNRDSALAMFERTVRFQPDYAPAYLNSGAVLLERGEKDRATTMFIRAAQLGSADAQQYLKRAGIPW
jgi:protein O-mannosyl-transferase